MIAASRRGHGPDGSVGMTLDLALYSGGWPLADVDLLLISAGMGAFYGPHQLDADKIDQMVAVNMRGPILLMNEYLLARRLAHRHGRAVAVTSTASRHAGHGLGLYAATKAAVESWVRAEGRHQRRYGVHLLAASLGWFESPMTAEIAPHVRRRAEARCPEGRFATLAEACEFTLSVLLDDGARYSGGRVCPFWEAIPYKESEIDDAENWYPDAGDGARALLAAGVRSNL